MEVYAKKGHKSPLLPQVRRFSTGYIGFFPKHRPIQVGPGIAHHTKFSTVLGIAGDTVIFFKTTSRWLYNDGSHFSTTVSGDTEGFPILKLHRDSVLYFKEPCPRYSKSHCVIKDTFMATVWTIHTDQKFVGTYSCNRATGHFRGRDYEVWFAPEIPVPTGPFKLGGLPGLILEAKSTDGAVVFQFEELVLSGNMTEMMQMPSGKDINMTFSEFMEDQDKHHKMLIANAKAKGFDISISRLERIELNTH